MRHQDWELLWLLCSLRLHLQQKVNMWHTLTILWHHQPQAGLPHCTFPCWIRSWAHTPCATMAASLWTRSGPAPHHCLWPLQIKKMYAKMLDTGEFPSQQIITVFQQSRKVDLNGFVSNKKATMHVKARNVARPPTGYRERRKSQPKIAVDETFSDTNLPTHCSQQGRPY